MVEGNPLALIAFAAPWLPMEEIMPTTDRPVILRTMDSHQGVPDSFDEEGRHWLLIGLTLETNRQIEEPALRTGDSKADLIIKALGFYKAASDAVRPGKFVGITDGEEELETEFVGF